MDTAILEARLAQFLRAKRAVAKRSESTLDWYQRQLRPWFAWLAQHADGPDDWLDPDLLEAYLEAEGEREIQDTTVVARYKAVRAFLNWQKRRRLLTGDLPTDLIEIPTARSRKPRVVDLIDVDTVIASIWQLERKNWTDFRDVLIIQIMRSCGLRVEELTGIRTWHVDTRDKFLYVESGKGDKDRIVPFDKDFQRAFTAYLLVRPPCRHADEILLLAANGHRQPTGPLTTNAIRQIIRRRCTAAGVAYFNPHSVRHAWAIERLNGGMALSAVSAAMGHTSTAFTAKVYARWVKSGLRREYDESQR
jgi:site-specific recombinase XerD